MLNVVDGAQTTSFTRKELQDLSDFQINRQEQGINFIGAPRRNRYLPGYLFRVKTPADFEALSKTLVKCMMEVNTRALGTKAAGEDYDEEYLTR